MTRDKRSKLIVISMFSSCTHGGISDKSVLDPLPGLVGLISVVSTRVQPSPLAPQEPGVRLINAILLRGGRVETAYLFVKIYGAEIRSALGTKQTSCMGRSHTL